MKHQISEKPVMYLDIDDTILMFPSNQGNINGWLELYYEKHDYGQGAPGVIDFIPWALKHFDVRWLTMWTPSGTLDKIGVQKLEDLTGVPKLQWEQIHNPLSHSQNKTEALNWDEINSGRPFIWLEDGLIFDELEILKNHKVYDRFIPCNVSKDPYALYKAWQRIRKLFKLPGVKNE